MMPESSSLRTSPGTSLLYIHDRVVVHSGDRRRLLEVPADQVTSLSATLVALADWHTPAMAAETVAHTVGTTLGRAAATVQSLAESGVLERYDRDPLFTDADGWARAGWIDAYRYHRHLRLLPIVDWSIDNAVRNDVALMRRYLSEEDQPAPYLDLAARRHHPTPPVESAAVSARAFRDTVTTAADSPINAECLATVLALTFGQTGTRQLPATGRHMTKTSPSGGSRHPTEAFVLLLRDIGPLAAGRYHWHVRDGALALLAAGDVTSETRTHVIRLRNRPSFDPAVVVVLVAICERSMFRYRESRSYRVLHHDVGHLLQTFAYVASSLGRPTYRGYTLDETAVTTMLNLNPLRQIPLAFGCLG